MAAKSALRTKPTDTRSALQLLMGGAGMGQAWTPPVPPQSVEGIGNRFGQPVDMEGIHKGTDIQAVEGTPAVAPVAGTVVDVRNEPGGLGWLVVIQGEDGTSHQLDHLEDGSITVRPGDRVQLGQRVASVGQSGAGATGPHMDYRVRDGQGNYVNPETVLPPAMAAMPPSPNTDFGPRQRMGTGQGAAPYGPRELASALYLLMGTPELPQQRREYTPGGPLPDSGPRRSPLPPSEWRGQWEGTYPPESELRLEEAYPVPEFRRRYLQEGDPAFNAGPTRQDLLYRGPDVDVTLGRGKWLRPRNDVIVPEGDSRRFNQLDVPWSRENYPPDSTLPRQAWSGGKYPNLASLYLLMGQTPPTGVGQDRPANRNAVGVGSAEDDARARRDAWVAAGAPDYAKPTTDTGGNVTGYQSVAAQPAEQRSQENQNLPTTVAWLKAGAPDYNAPIKNAAGQITGYQPVTATPVEQRSASLRNLEKILAGYTAAALAPTAVPAPPAPVGPGQVRTTTVTPTVTPTTTTWNNGVPQSRYSDDVASELAARYYAAQFGVPVEQARNDFRSADPNYRASAIGMAQAGQLDYLLNQTAPTAQPTAQPTTTGTGRPVAGSISAFFYGPGDVRWSGNPNTPNSYYLPGGPGYKATTTKPGPVVTTTPRAGTNVASPLQSGDQGQTEFSALMADLQRRAGILGVSATPANKTRQERALAAIWDSDQGARQTYLNSPEIAANDWKGAVTKFLDGKDPVTYATDQGFMPKAPPRTLAEMVDARTLEILKGQGLASPNLEERVNKQLEAAYQADLAGTEAPKPELTGEGGSFLPPIPSTQFWSQVLNQPEREGAAQLFQAMGLTPQQLADQITRLAPPAGASSLAAPLYRRA